MISTHRLIRALEHERARVKLDELDTDFVKGMTQGLTLAIAVTKTVWKITQHQKAHNPTGAKRIPPQRNNP